MHFLTLLFPILSLLTTASARDNVRHYYTHNPAGSPYSYDYQLRVNSWIGIQGGDANTQNIYSCRHPYADLNLLTLDANCEGASGFVLEGIMTTLWRDPQPNSIPVARLVSGIADHAYWTYNANTGGYNMGVGCDFGRYTRESFLGYAPTSLAAHPTAQQIYEFRKGCNGDGDECGGCA